MCTDWTDPKPKKSNRWSIDEGKAAKRGWRSLAAILDPVETPATLLVHAPDGTQHTVTEGK